MASCGEMDSSSVRRTLRLRSLLLVVVIACCAVASHMHVCAVGSTYRYRLDDFAGVSLSREHIQPEPDDIVRVKGISYDDGVPVVEFEALREGTGMVLVNTDKQGMMFWIAVKPGMVVVADEVNFTGWEVVGWSLAICFLAACVLCLWNLLWLRRRAWYGYEMSACAGLALFCGFQAVSFGGTMALGHAHDFVDLVLLVVSLADRFVQLSLLPMTVVALLVSASNFELMRHEGRGFGNMLGMALGVAWVLAYVGWQVISHYSVTGIQDPAMSVGINSMVAATIAFAVSLFAGTCLCAWLAARHVPQAPRDYLMILGCGLRQDGSPTPLLAGRIDAARSYAMSQVEQGFASPVFVPSGGKGADEVWAEAESMRRYLLEQGIDEEHILKEDLSTNTRQNFELSAKVIAQARPDGADKPRVAFSTTNYHVFRSYVYAHDAGLDAEGIAAPTKGYFWPNAFLREFVGLLTARPVMLATTLLLTLGIYAVAEYVLLIA